MKLNENYYDEIKSSICIIFHNHEKSDIFMN